MGGGCKQNNKKHKDNSKISNKPGKAALPTLSKKKAIDLSKDLRVLQKQQKKKSSIKRNAESDYAQRGNNGSAPLLCGIFPLFEFNNIDVVLSLLKSTDPEAKILKSNDSKLSGSLFSTDLTMNSKKFRKNFTFTSCRNFRDRFDYLDTAKVVDWAIFILPNDFDELIGDYTEDLLASLIAQGLPSSCFCLISDLGPKIKWIEKSFESLTKLSLGDTKITPLTNLNDANKLMRHLSNNCKPSFISTSKANVCSKSVHKKKGYFIVEDFQHNSYLNKLKVSGCMRGYGMNLDTTSVIHLTEVGDFKLGTVNWISPEDSNKMITGSLKKIWIAKEKVIEEASKDEMNDANSNVNESDEDSKDEEMEDLDSSFNEEEVSDIGSDDSEDSENANDDKMSFASTAHTGYSIAQIQKFRKSREETMFPDEIEIDCTLNARDKLRKYRGLRGFKSDVWPTNENIPDSYRNIHQFRNYKHERNTLCNKLEALERLSAENFVKPGCKFEMILDDFNEESMKKLMEILKRNPLRHLICSNLFQFEDMISVLHFNGRRLASVDDSAVKELAKCNNNSDLSIPLGEDATSMEQLTDPNIVLAPKAEPIESKETMLYQVGFRRFTATPIYSEFNANSDQRGSNGKAKYCKFMDPKKNVVATLYGPVTYGPVSMLQFRLRQKDLGFDEMGPPYIAELVATGSLLSVDPTRPIIKRILLSGEIYKVNKRSVMVRYMFFNTEDIEQFKEVPLHTKNGRKGRIVKSTGTHGYMKCSFDKPLSQVEVVLMPLYKRVFPKCTTQNMYDLLPDSQQIDEETMDTMDAMF